MRLPARWTSYSLRAGGRYAMTRRRPTFFDGLQRQYHTFSQLPISRASYGLANRGHYVTVICLDGLRLPGRLLVLDEQLGRLRLQADCLRLRLVDMESRV